MRPIKKRNLKLFEHGGDEKIIGEAHRHVIGAVYLLLTGGFTIFILGLMMAYVVSNEGDFFTFFGLDYDIPFSEITAVALGLVIIGVFIGSLLAVYVYSRHFLILTDKKIVVCKNINVFQRKVSQLPIGDVQDVTIIEPSILARLLKYGTMTIETAGEQNNINITFASKIFPVSKEIIEAHEKNMQQYGN